MDQLIFIESPPIVLFYEIRKVWSEEEWADLLDEFEALFEGTELKQQVKNLIADWKPRYW